MKISAINYQLLVPSVTYTFLYESDKDGEYLDQSNANMLRIIHSNANVAVVSPQQDNSKGNPYTADPEPCPKQHFNT